MTSDDAELEARADALRRIVYGTPDGFTSSAVDELESVEAELARRAGASAGATVPSVEPVATEGSPETGRPEASANRDRRRSRLGPRALSGLAIVAVLAGFAVVGAVALVTLWAPTRGLAVFDRPQRPDDESLTVALGAQADTVRRIDEVFGRGFWAYLNGVDQVCLSVVPEGTNLVERGECASRARFEEHGIAVQYAVTELGAHRPADTSDQDVIVISWSPDAEGVTWELVLIDPPAPDRMTYDEWSRSRDAR